MKTGGPLKEKEVLEDEKLKRVRTQTGVPLKEKEMLGDKKVKRVYTYAEVVSASRATDRLSNR